MKILPRPCRQVFAGTGKIPSAAEETRQSRVKWADPPTFREAGPEVQILSLRPGFSEEIPTSTALTSWFTD